jgi:hypothetical protein
MNNDVIAALEAEMARAVADEDFEFAAILRDRLDAMREGRPTGSMLRRQEPGAMGLGTSQEVYVPPTGRAAPKRPDPMTKGHRPGGRRST